MKSFFKKLAFVMALAMVVSLAAPAAQSAFAATEFTYAEQESGDKVTTLNMKAGDEVDLKFIGVRDYRNYTLEWVSSNEAVATVDKNGVITAVADGVTTVELRVGDGTDYVSTPVIVAVGEVARVSLGTSKDNTFTAYTLNVGATVDLNFYGVTDWAAGKYVCTWLSSNTAVATVDKMGVVTPVAAGTTEVTVAIVDKATGAAWSVIPVVITVPESKVSDSFTAVQTKDSEATLTFANTEITKADLEANLSFYYYVGDVEIAYPIQVDSVKDGVAVLKPYVTFVDGFKYGFRYGEETAEFTASVGEAVGISYAWSCDGDSSRAYVGTDTEITCTLRDANGIDVTASALARNGASMLFTLVEEATNGEFWISDAGTGATGKIYFNEKAVARVQVEYITGRFTETTYEPIPGPKQVIPIVSTDAPAYGIDVSVRPTATIITPKENGEYKVDDWNKASTVIALGDDNGHRLVVKMKDTKGKDVDTLTGPQSGNFSFATTNNSILYVDATTGTLMTNGTGTANVLVYFTPAGATSGTVVAVVSVNVRPTRAVTAVSVDKASDVVSTEAPYDEATFTITLTDQLNDKIDGNVSVTCNNADRLPNGATQPPVIGTVENSEKGVYKVKITGAEANLPQNANGYSYTFTVKVGNITRTFSVTVRKPLRDNDGNLTVSGYRVEFGGDSDLKTTDGNTKAATATLYILSNGVKAAVGTIEERPASVSEATVGNYYYTVTKGGQRLELKESGNSVTIPLTGTKTETASGSAVNVVDKGANGTGSYTVVVYRAVGTTGSASATAFTQVASNTLTVKDSQDTMSYAGRKSGVNSYGATSNVEELVTNCFRFKLGNDTFDNAETYDKKGIIVVADVNKVANENGVLVSGSVCFVKTVTFYVPAGGDVYVKYTVTVNDYVEIQ